MQKLSKFNQPLFIQQVELFRATVTRVGQDGICDLIIYPENRLLSGVQLTSDRHGEIKKNGTIQSFYRGDELSRNLLSHREVKPGDKIDVHLTYRNDEVVRWQELDPESMAA